MRDPENELEVTASSMASPNEGLIKQVLESQIDCPDLSQQVLAQFSQELQEAQVPCQYDFEFVSAYFDGALSTEIADNHLLTLRITTFEKHLPQCSLCTTQLGQIFELSEAYRQHCYRLEQSLSAFDVTPQVMTLWQVEQNLLNEAHSLPNAGCGAYPVESLSAYLDQETITENLSELESHLASCQACTDTLDTLKSVSSNISGYQTRLLDTEESVPALEGLWSRIAAQLETGNVVEMKRPYQAQKWTIAASSAIAASLLFFVFSGQLFTTPKASLPAVNTAALEQALLADEADSARRSTMAENASTTVMYHSPEAYLFSSEPDLFSEEAEADEVDVSAIVLNQDL